MAAIRVLIADDHARVRAGLRALLAAMDDAEVVGEAADGVEALALAEALRPDVLLVDISMPRLDGLGLTAALAAGPGRARVLIFSFHTERAYAERLLRAGAAGYLVKGSNAAEVRLAIRSVARGETYVSPAVSARAPDGGHHAGPG